MLDRFKGYLKRYISSSQYTEALRNQPFAREYWLAEDATLKRIFDDVNDVRFNNGIKQISEDLYQRLSINHAIPKGQEHQYSELCLRNARRLEWDSAGRVLGLNQELGNQWQILMQRELEQLGVWDQFNHEYGPDSIKGKIISTDPNKPYF